MRPLIKKRVQFDYARYLLSKHLRYLVLTSLACIIANGFLVFTNPFAGGPWLVDGAFFQTVIAVVGAFFVSGFLFDFLNKRYKADIFFSLPIKRSDLFGTLFVTGMILVFVPYLCGWLSALPFYGQQIGEAFEVFLINLPMIMAVFALLVFVQMNTGNLLESVLFSGIALLLPILICGVWLLYCNTMLLGYASSNLSQLFLVFCYFSPLAAGIATFFDWASLSAFTFWLSVYWGVITVVLALLSSYLFQKRKAQQVQVPFTNPVFFPLLMGAFALAIQLLFWGVLGLGFYYDIRYMVLPFAFAWLVYVIVDAVAHRGFKNVIQAGVVYALIGIAGFMIILPANATGGFGFVKRVPDNEDVASVYVNINDFVLANYQFSSYDNKLLLEDEESIATITSFHQELLDYYEQSGLTGTGSYDIIWQSPSVSAGIYTYPYTTFDNYYSSLEITYVLKDGSSISRSYTYPTDWGYSLTSSNIVRQLTIQNLDVLLPSRNDLLVDSSASEYENINGIINDNSNILVTLNNLTYSAATNIRTKEDLIALTEALKLDIADQDLLSAKSTYLGDLTITANVKETIITYSLDGEVSYQTASSLSYYAYYISLNSEMTNTLAFLAEKGYEIPAQTMSKAVLVLPMADLEKSAFFTFSPSLYYGEDMTFTYYRLTARQFEQIRPYLLTPGLAKQAGCVLIFQDANGYEFAGIIDPQYTGTVLNLLKNNELYQTTGWNFFYLLEDVPANQ